jgi:ubiquinone/menaquinone biosynthesis C-methylase UbiE
MNYFDRMAADWDSELKRVELASAVGDAMIASLSLRPDWRIMDYGAGTGLLTLKLQPHVGSITAVDTSPKMIEVLQEKIARCRISNIRTMLWNVESDPIWSADLDAVVASMVMHHIPDTQGALNRFYEMLKEGGIVALADLESEAGDFHPPENPVPHHGFERSAFADCLTNAGFVNIQFSKAHVLQKPTSAGALKEYPVFLAVAQK